MTSNRRDFLRRCAIFVAGLAALVRRAPPRQPRPVRSETFSGAIAVVATDATSAARQHLALTNAYALSKMPNDSPAMAKYLSALFTANDRVALLRDGVLVEYGRVAQSPSPVLGEGSTCIDFASRVNPRKGDLLVFVHEQWVA